MVRILSREGGGSCAQNPLFLIGKLNVYDSTSRHNQKERIAHSIEALFPVQIMALQTQDVRLESLTQRFRSKSSSFKFFEVGRMT